MKYHVMLRAKIKEGQTALEKNHDLIIGLSKITAPWGGNKDNLPVLKITHSEPSHYFTLSKLFGKGIRGYVNYQNRKYYLEEGFYDDYLTLEFNPEKVEYKSYVLNIFQDYVKIFNPYMGYIGNMESLIVDMEKFRKSNIRKEVVRIQSVNYFDNILCQTAFNLSSKKLVEILTGEVEKVYEWENGIIIIYSSNILTLEEELSINEKLRFLFERNNSQLIN